MNQTNQTIQILEMETKLAEDDSGAYRDQLFDELNAALVEVKRHIDQGLSPDEFQRFQYVVNAIETSITVIERTWQSSPNRQLS
ncbi:MAG: EscE/YscE/SsaE family type III secretion system needle protein co-chaperone [Pirellulales bacterium]|nr:EscE/YscE/SsaE family type III secretion system needle protein co-chaperone [Pirellulales bacterium]